MAYAAVISLKQTIQRLLNSSRTSVASSTRQILEFAYDEATNLQQVLKRLDSCSCRSERLNALDGEIRDAVHKLEDSLDFPQLNDQFLPEYSGIHGDLDLEELTREINSFVETAKNKKEEYITELDNPRPEEEDDDNHDDDDDEVVSSRIDCGGNLVGLCDEITKIKNLVTKSLRPDDLGVVWNVGAAGTGRTVVAKIIFENLCTSRKQYFDCGAWVTVGPKYQFEEILRSILDQVDDDDDDDTSDGESLVPPEGDEKSLGEYLYARLKGRRYMIVLDDVWDTETWEYLRKSFPDQNNGSLVLLTTGLTEAARSADSLSVYEFPTLSEERTWDALRAMIFGEEPCPRELVAAGKKIAENCRGLAVPLIRVIFHLYNDNEKTPEYWNELAADKENSIFTADEVSQLSKIREALDLGCSLPNEDFHTSAMEVASPVLNVCDHIEEIKMHLFPERLFSKMEIISIIGMAGNGKTTFAKRIFEDPSVLHYFDYHAWVTLGPTYQSEEILVDILAQIYPEIDKMNLKEDENLAMDLCDQLSNKRCLIVLDDVWNKEPLHRLEELFPNIKGRALVTTRLENVAQFGECDRVHKMHLLNKEESWRLLCQRVFAEKLCPPELVKAGKKIAENCEGLPLMILTIANLLSEVERTLECWNKVAEKQNSIFMDAHNQVSKVLSPSYKYLPQHLKACFLYMGVFPQNYEIPTFKLMNLWISEGFLEPKPFQLVEDFAAECLLDLVHRNLVMVCESASNFGNKTCHLHSVFWHLSNDEAVKNRFFHAFNTYADNLVGGIKSQRRLCIRNSILLGMKDVHNSIASTSTGRSLLCTGPHHQYPVPICFDLRLLRILNVLTIRFYEFPIEVVKLIYLRYLALTCNGKVPASISKLWNLQFLIVRRYLSIKSLGDSPYLPMEIWDMKELKHLQITGSSLPSPSGKATLPNLLTLLDVSAHCCTKRILKRIPNLKRLRVRIELSPDNNRNPFCCLKHISRLHGLESLKCVVVNPEFRSQVAAPVVPRSMFPANLRKLTLSGLGYPWKYMSMIGTLQNLEVLKLQSYAFRGPKWETNSYDFVEVKFLSIEETDLEHWKLKMPSFLNLECLSIKYCYKLEELPPYLLDSVNMIEVVDCNPLAVTWAKEMKEKHLKSPVSSRTFEVQVDSSWDVGNLKQ